MSDALLPRADLQMTVIGYGFPAEADARIEHSSPVVVPEASKPGNPPPPAATMTARPVQFVPAVAAAVDDPNAALLRSRLIAAGGVLLAILTVHYLIALSDRGTMIHWLRGAVWVATVGCLVVLTSAREFDSRKLRGVELLLFSLIGIQFLFWQLDGMLQASQHESLVELTSVQLKSVAGFSLLMMAYGMFMPNGWRRTAVMLVPPALGPGGMIILAILLDPWIALHSGWEFVAEVTGLLAMVAGIAVYGTHAIAGLRTEAGRARKLGQYVLKRAIGHGGMGDVYLAEHRLLRRPCAVKLIHNARGSDPGALERFEREVQSTAQLSHWHTVEIYDYGRTEDGTFYYVMEYLPGLNLNDLVARFGPVTPGRAIHFLRQTCGALAEAHAKGLIHRDLKPANIQAAHRGGVFDFTKLLDFGLVLECAPQQGSATSERSKTSGPFAGSPLYMSPEQATGEAVLDPRSDIYAVGAVGYYLLTGRPPFEGRSGWQVMIAHARDPVVPPSKYVPDLPADLERVLLRCLSKDPADRYPDAMSVHRALIACQNADDWSPSLAREWWLQNAPQYSAEG